MNEAELLFCHLLKCDKAGLCLDNRRVLAREETNQIAAVLKKRIHAEPLQYILGQTEFMGLEFKVNKDVLIPRPETEILVETAIKLSQDAQRITHNVLEIGTGSGCIAVSLAKFLPAVNVVATDISEKALEIAATNAQQHSVSDRIDFVLADLFAHNAQRTAQYDIILSNPPYIPTDEIDKLQPELQYEPFLALDGGRDGLDFYRRLIKESGKFLRREGLLILEIGYGQVDSLSEIIKNNAGFRIVEIVKDYSNIERVMVLRKNG